MCLLQFASVAWGDAAIQPLSQLTRFLPLPEDSSERIGLTPEDALAVAIAIWLAFSLTDVVTPRGTHLATLTVMVTVEASIVGQHRHDLTAEHPHTMDPA